MAHKITENSSMLLVQEKNSQRFLLSQYDATHPKESYRLRVNLIGGAQEKKDKSPYDTLVRELKEEFSPSFVHSLQKEILQKAQPYKDFLSIFQTPYEYVSIDSVYHSVIDRALFEEAENQIKKGKKLVREGLVKIVSLEDLVNGEPLTAWSTGEIISDIFNVKIPNPDQAVSIPMLTPIRDSHQAYREDFEYLDEGEIEYL